MKPSCVTPELPSWSCCPVCHDALQHGGAGWTCQGPACRREYPLAGGRAVLISPENELFDVGQYRAPATRRRPPWAPLTERLPTLSADLQDRAVYDRLIDLAQEDAPRRPPRVLVVGSGSHTQAQWRARFRRTAPTITLCDPSPDSPAEVAADAAQLPFRDGAVDVVITEAVLEHVPDPHRCVGELTRVLRDGGVVYSELPFMQQVHAGAFDFERFSHLGHIRLFRDFVHLDSGLVAGPGTAAGWALDALCKSLVRSRSATRVVGVVTRLSFFWLKYLDRLTRKAPAALDGASCTYFVGRKTTQALPDRELLAMYRGALGAVGYDGRDR